LWWTNNDHTPPLVTTSRPRDQGILGAESTEVLFGGALERDPYSGGRFTAGYWFGDCTSKAIEFSGFFLSQRSSNFDASSAMTPVLARPFFNLNQNKPFSEIVASPGISTGNIHITSPGSVWGVESNFRCNICCGCNYYVDLLAGYRYLNLDESLTIMEDVQGGPKAPAPFTNARATGFDSFTTHNQFNGGQVGLETRWTRGRWSLDFTGKVALGDTHQVIDIDGASRLASPDGTVTQGTGTLLALPSNIGHFTQDRFSVVPEATLTLGYQVTDHLRTYVGYNVLYWSSVVRPGDQIDPVLDITQLPFVSLPPGIKPTGQNRPMVPFHTTDFWAQGLVLGLEFTY
jgi:hypothetical protein